MHKSDKKAQTETLSQPPHSNAYVILVGLLCLVAIFFEKHFQPRYYFGERVLENELYYALASLETQWLAVLGIAAPAATMLSLIAKRRRSLRHFALLLLLLATLQSYFSTYGWRYSQLTFVYQMIAVGIGLLIAAAVKWHLELARNQMSACGIYCLLIVLLPFTLVQGSDGVSYLYRGVVRWGGVWCAPNTSGAIAASGAVAALVLSFGLRVSLRAQHPIRQSSVIVVIGISLILLVLYPIGLLMTGSRGALLAAIVVAILVSAVAVPSGPAKRMSTTWFRLRNVFVCGCTFALSFVACVILTRARSESPAMLTRAIASDAQSTTSLRNRVVAWRASVRMIYDRLWRGHGWAMARYKYETVYTNERHFNGGAIVTNSYLRLGIECGGLALIAKLIVIYRFLWLPFRIWLAKPPVYLAEYVQLGMKSIGLVLAFTAIFAPILSAWTTCCLFWAAIFTETRTQQGSGNVMITSSSRAI